MKAMILAAGLGSRLKSITANKPKALVEFRGRTLLENAIEYLKYYGVSEIVINVHHFADQVIDFVRSKNNFGINIVFSDERNILLDTGGGILNAIDNFKGNNSFIVYNVDIITNLNLHDLISKHNETSSLASLCVRERKSSRYLLFDDFNLLVGWENVKTGEQIIAKSTSEYANRFAFSGIHIINPIIFKNLSYQGKFSIIEAYLEIAKNNNISAYNHSDSAWFDMGKIEDFENADKEIPELNF